MSSDWEEFWADPDLPTEIKNRASQWQSNLLAYVERLPAHIDRLRAVISSAPR